MSGLYWASVERPITGPQIDDSSRRKEMNLNLQKFNQTVEAAKARAPQMAKQRDTAAENLLANPFIADVDGGLLILSDSGQTYRATSRRNKCQCKAHDFNQRWRQRPRDRLDRPKQRGTQPLNGA